MTEALVDARGAFDRHAWDEAFATLTAADGDGEGLGPSDLELLHQSTVLVEHAKGHGTGAIIGPGTVLTAFHVVEEEPLDVTFFRGETQRGWISWQDPALDLAVIKVRVPEGYPTPEIWCGDLQPGQHLMLVGHPTHSRWVAVGGYLPATDPFEGELVALGSRTDLRVRGVRAAAHG
jgi:S1-C subfamily serine protease